MRGGSGMEVTKTGEAGLFRSMAGGRVGSFAVLMMCSVGVKWRVTKNVIREERVRIVDCGRSNALEKWLIGIGQCFGVGKSSL